MSIAEFFIENCIDPSDPYHADRICDLAGGGVDSDDENNRKSNSEELLGTTIVPTYSYGGLLGMPNGLCRYTVSDIPDPAKNDTWSSLCADDQWKYKPASSVKGELYFCEVGESTDYWGEDAKLKAIPPTQNMHRWALAPKLVFETSASKIGDEKSLEAYMKRLICAVSGRFVVIDRCGASEDESLTSSDGQPNPAVKYRYRYWDNHGNVYDTIIAKCRQTIKWEMGGRVDKDVGWENLMDHGMMPGDFRTDQNMPVWMRVHPGKVSVIDDSGFWDSIYLWAHDGTTYCSEWDQRLAGLAKLAGVPGTNMSKNWPLDESKLDAEARAKGWMKMECQQPAMASYRKDDTRLNFYLSTGTVGSCLDHPKKRKTQLFRKYMENPMTLFDNPREHTGKGYFTKSNNANGDKKRKAQNDEIHTRSCASCKDSKSIDEFSKNQQRRYGPNARCMSCVQASS